MDPRNARKLRSPHVCWLSLTEPTRHSGLTPPAVSLRTGSRDAGDFCVHGINKTYVCMQRRSDSTRKLDYQVWVKKIIKLTCMRIGKCAHCKFSERTIRVFLKENILTYQIISFKPLPNFKSHLVLVVYLVISIIKITTVGNPQCVPFMCYQNNKLLDAPL